MREGNQSLPCYDMGKNHFSRHEVRAMPRPATSSTGAVLPLGEGPHNVTKQWSSITRVWDRISTEPTDPDASRLARVPKPQKPFVLDEASSTASDCG